MRKINVAISIVSIVLLASLSKAGFARDDIGDYSVAQVLSTEHAKAKLGGVRYYFGTKKHGKVIKRYGLTFTNQKTSAFAKSDQEACEWVFLSAMIQLKKKAQQLGGNAIINIKSNYRDNLTSSNKTFKCGAGAVIAGVALQGEIVSLK